MTVTMACKQPLPRLLIDFVLQPQLLALSSVCPFLLTFALSWWPFTTCHHCTWQAAGGSAAFTAGPAAVTNILGSPLVLRGITSPQY